MSRLGQLQSRSADLDYYYGIALARSGRWREAESAFREGKELAPSDSRFPVELAGVAFRQKKYREASSYLRRALKLNPDDQYANDFLGTVYFLEGNLEGALKYWNRVGKPQIAELRADPETRIDPALLDRAFAFSPSSTLQLAEFLSTNVRIRGLGIFPRYQFDLQAREDNNFDVLFRNQERNGFGSTKWEAALLFFRALPFLAVTPEYFNFRREAINFVSLVRWDPQKRRLLARVSSPFEHSAKYRFEVSSDLRNENWSIPDSSQGSFSTLASLNMRRGALSFALASFASERWRWSAGAEVSYRDFRNIIAGTVLTPELVAKGFQLKQLAQLETMLWRLPEHRFTLGAEVSTQAARLWSQPRKSFEKLQGSLKWHWFPKAEGDDYELQQLFRAGKTFGTAPFDELVMLGLERDNDLLMRGHIGTHDGRKGSAPLGLNYFVSNWEVDKSLYRNGLLTWKVGPFLDTGTISDPSPALGSHKWLWDTGVQTKLRIFGTGVVFSYGKDLRSGNNAFYVTTLR